MNLLQALMLGILEGATEFLPISSTFHLIWASRFLGVPQTDFQKAFDVIIQAGAILAIVVLYWSTLLKNRQLVMKLLSSFVPTAIIGLVLYKVIKNFFFENVLLQLGVFIGVGLFFILFEKFRGQKLHRALSDMTLAQAVMIGIVQSLAVIPGVSRAGAVMIALMFLQVKRDEAATYSFLLAVPTLLAAAGLDAIKTAPYILSHGAAVELLVIGFAAAFVSAMIAVKWFISFLQKHTLSSFGLYRLILGILLLFSFLSQHQ